MMEQYVRRALHEGSFGWEVTDCTVTMNACEYFVGHGAQRRSRSTSGRIQVGTSRTTAADFRKLTPLVLMRALERAGTVVCEPMIRLSIEIPTDTVGAVLAAVARLGGAVEAPSLRGDLSAIETVLAAARAQELQRQLPGLSGGEGVVEANFSGYQPVRGAPRSRRSATANPLNREEYMLHLARRAVGAPNRSPRREGLGTDEQS